MHRARERQRKLQELTGATETPVSLRASNQTENSKLATRKEVVSDSCLMEKAVNTPLKENNSEGNIMKCLRQNSKTQVSSDMPGSPRNQLKTLNIQKEDFNMEIIVSSTENVRVEVQIEEEDDDENNAACLRADAKHRLKRLGKLYAGKLLVTVDLLFIHAAWGVQLFQTMRSGQRSQDAVRDKHLLIRHDTFVSENDFRGLLLVLLGWCFYFSGTY